MATSTFFNNYGASNEQVLLEDLIIESIQIYGLDFYYLPRTLNNLDDIFLDDDISTYGEALQLEMYVKNIEGFEGQGSFMSKFGLEIQDQITFSIAKRRFDVAIGIPLELARPRESDLVYYPLNNKLFQIKYVENKPIHYPLGILPVYDIYCELFQYSNERFETGIPLLDDAMNNLSLNIYDFALVDSDGNYLTDSDDNVLVNSGYNPDVIDPIENNTEIADHAEDIIEFSEDDPYSEGWSNNL